MYRYFTRNHNQYFVDPLTRVHTQLIENKWGHWKSEVRHIKGVRDRQLRSRRRELFGKNDAFYNFWNEITIQYPVNR